MKRRNIPQGQALGRPAVRSIAEEWRTYREEVLNVHSLDDGRLVKAGPAQVEHGLPQPLTLQEATILEELRLAFYAGASALYAMTVFGLGDETIGEEEAAKLLEHVGDEILAFGEEERRRRRPT